MLKLRAFNLVPGAAFVANDGRRYVATSVGRDDLTEYVLVVARPLSIGFGFDQQMVFDYCTPLELVGLVVNPDDASDDDFGV